MKNLITCLVVCVLSGAAIADTWTVDDDGKADFDNIQAAIDAASDGDEIIVAPGTYTSTAEEVVDMLGKEIWLHSSGGTEVTIIDGEGTRRGIICTSGETSGTIIEGFTITNGYSNDLGGGMKNDNSSPTLTNCTFNTNSGDEGGGMQNYYSSPTVTDCTFTNNTANYGGGMENHFSNPTLTNCTFMNNSADTYGGGLGNFDSSNPTLINTTVCSNTPDQIYDNYTDGGGNTIEDVCTLAGACCLPDATCLGVGSEEACLTLGGVYSGDDVYCSESPCVRACCFGDKTCSDMLVSDCATAGGIFHEFRMCESYPCVTSWTVDDDGKADFDNIQAAVDAATDGDEIIVMPGTYTSTQDGHVVYVVDKSLTIRSVDPTDPEIVVSTIIDGQGVRRGIVCADTTAVALNDSSIVLPSRGQKIHPYSTNAQVNHRNDSGVFFAKCFEGEQVNRASRGSNEWTEANSISIEGFTIVNGYAAKFDYPGGWWASSISGGGILGVDSNLFISNCSLSANSGYQGGAIGLLMHDGGASKITGCQITGNSTFDGADFGESSWEWGAGICAFLYYRSEEGNLEISDCTVADNTSHYVGGGIGTFWVDVSLTNCTIQNNSVENYENEEATNLGCGGMTFAEGNAQIEGCSFIGNKGLLGGALATQLQPGNGETLVLEVNNCLFDNNIAEGYHDDFGIDACGGAVVLNHYDSAGATTEAYLTNCEFINNSATIGGGVTLGVPPLDIYNASATLTGCVFKGNSAVSYGGGMWVAEKAVAEVYSTVVCGNTPNWITGPWINGDGNTIDLYCLDECPDPNADGVVDIDDLIFAVSIFGTEEAGADFNNDGIVNIVDLLILLSNWGPCE